MTPEESLAFCRVGKGSFTPNLSQNRTWQSPVIRLFLPQSVSNQGLSAHCSPNLLRPVLIPAFAVSNSDSRDKWVPSLHPHYKGFNTTTNPSAPVCCIGIRPRGFSTCAFPLAPTYRFSCSVWWPRLDSCLLYTVCRITSNQVSVMLFLPSQLECSFDKV